MSAWGWLAAAALLSLERLCYVWIARAPEHFRATAARIPLAAARDPVDVIGGLFVVFKGIQAGVFFGWCYAHGGGSLWPPDGPPAMLALGTSLAVAGQALSASVFYRLGRVGVFYGDRFGATLPWCRDFPFSRLDHPQYVGAWLSIWGFFLVMRFPHADWIALPILETVYYAVGARLEGGDPAAGPTAASAGARCRDQRPGVW